MDKSKKKIMVTLLGVLLIGLIAVTYFYNGHYTYKTIDTPETELASKLEKVQDKHTDSLVVFHKKGCSSCRQVAPEINQLVKSVKRTNKHLNVIVIDVANSENKKYTKQYGVYYVPTFIQFTQGKETNRYTGTSFNIIKTMFHFND